MMKRIQKLFREVRFSINPFEEYSSAGANSYASKPCGEGLGLYFSLGVELAGPVEDRTGFIVNVSEIDRHVRDQVVPIFFQRLGDLFRRHLTVRFGELAALLEQSSALLVPLFPSSRVNRLRLRLNPFCSLTFVPENSSMLIYSEKFEFAAMHRLWNDQFSEPDNFERFGKCANPNGHGHNYVIEVAVQIPVEAEKNGWIAEFESTVKDLFIEKVDHKNLNKDVPEFRDVNPTVENIVRVAWDCLQGRFAQRLRRVTVWENDRTSCSMES